MQSLLGQFYNRIKGSQEDIASESLTYILNKSIKARQTINQIINLNTGLNFTDLSYKTQNVGDKLERPDISGINENGKESLLIEAKFWSSLTSNQPNEYLNRLEDNTVLIFLVPKLRRRAIYEEVLNKIAEKFSDIETEPKNLKIKINQTNKFIIIKSWNEVLNAIRSELLQEKNQSLISDIDQIIGFCETIDNNSFQPMIDSDLSPSIPKKICSYYDIVDQVVREIKNRIDEPSIKILRTGGAKYDYVKYFSIKNIGMGMCLKMEFWSKYTDTPFWLFIGEKKVKHWKSTEKFKKNCERIALSLNHKYYEKNDYVYFSLKPKLEKTEDIVIKDLAEQIITIFQEVEKQTANKNI